MSTVRVSGTLTITPSTETIVKLGKIRTSMERTLGIVPENIPTPSDYGVGSEDWEKIHSLDIGKFLEGKGSTFDTTRLVFSAKKGHASTGISPELDFPVQMRKIVKIVKASGATLDGVATLVDSDRGVAVRMTVKDNKLSFVKGEVVIQFADGSTAELDF